MSKTKNIAEKNKILNSRLNDLSATLAVLIHRLGGDVRLSKEELDSCPKVTFHVHRDDEGISLKLLYHELSDIPEKS